jgi:hypothetical protein
MTRIVNLREEKCDVKCCRTKDGKVLPVPDPSCLGNPFVMFGEKDRERVVSLFRDYFYDRIKNDIIFATYVTSLKGKILGCFCKQANTEVACHLDIVKEYLDSIGELER